MLFSSVDTETVVFLWENRRIEAWDFTTGQAHQSLNWNALNPNLLFSTSINQYTMPDARQSVASPDTTLNARAESGKVLVTKVSDSSVARTIYANVTQNTDLIFSADSSTLATISLGPTIRIWNVADGRQICVINGDGAYPDIADAIRLFFSDDGRTLAVFHKKGMISYWDAKSCHRQRTYWINNTAISPDGSFFVEPQSSQLNLRKFNDGSLLRSLYGKFENSRLTALGFSTDGKFFGAVYADRTTHLWGIVP